MEEQEPASYVDDPYQPPEFKNYLPNITDQDAEVAEAIVEELGVTLSTMRLQKDKFDVYKSTAVPIDYQELVKRIQDNTVCLEVLNTKPDVFLGCLSLALAKIVLEDTKINDVPRIHARLYNYEPRISLRQLKSHMIGKFVSIKGTVIRVSSIFYYQYITFECTKCGKTFPQKLVDGKFVQPTKCAGPGCKGKLFEPDKRSAVTVDWQKIRIQEEVDHKDSGRVPRNIEAELTGDLVDSCVPGDVITISGIVKVVNIEAERGNAKNAQNKSLFQIYIDANSIDNNKVDTGGKVDNMDFTTSELYMVQDISTTKDNFRLIVNSICPSIYGHEVVKAGLTLALFGGTQKYTGEKNRLPIRNESHVLIVGDPGLGKSQMLMAINNISPRGVYVCGSYSSTTGLTVTLMKESGTGDYSLEAGALVLGDQGCCCIDEFDKMPTEHQALLEAMEQQSVSIAKAGIVCNLPARTSVIAAANPAGGHYDRSKTVSENLKMGPALLSRFDVIFILLDRPDAERDKMLSEHVISLHGSRVKAERDECMYLYLCQMEYANIVLKKALNVSWRSSDVARGELGEYLKTKPGDCEAIPPALLRKYISYARKYCHPRLSPEACEVLQEFYLKLRRENKTPEGTPITTRQLESLIRLAEARAKLELQEVVTANHARDVVAIMKESIFETMEDERGNVDFRRAGGMSKRNIVRQFETILAREAKRQSCSEFSKQYMKTVFDKSPLVGENFNDTLDAMSTHGILLKTRNGWKLASSDY